MFPIKIKSISIKTENLDVSFFSGSVRLRGPCRQLYRTFAINATEMKRTALIALDSLDCVNSLCAWKSTSRLAVIRFCVVLCDYRLPTAPDLASKTVCLLLLSLLHGLRYPGHTSFRLLGDVKSPLSCALLNALRHKDLTINLVA